MKAILVDRLYQKCKIFIYYLIFSMVPGFLLIRDREPIKILITYLILCLYWNLLFKGIGRPRNWDLMWSLPLKERDVLVGTSLSLLITGWLMNLALYLYFSLYLLLPWKLLLIVCCLTVFTDVILQMMSYGGRNKLENFSIYIVWIALSFLPLFFGKEKILMAVEWFSSLAAPYLLLVAVLFYLVLSFLLLFLLKRNRRKARNGA